MELIKNVTYRKRCSAGMISNFPNFKERHKI